jgi:type VI secretion system secreted protein Hcp
MAQVDYFLKIEGVKGESVDDKHRDEIDVLSFSWGVTQTGTMSHGGGGGEGKASFNDFNFTHHVDKASPALFKACATGEHIKEAVVVGRKSSDVDRGASQFFKYTFTDVIISLNKEAGDKIRGVTDSAAFRFASVKVEATPGERIDISAAAFGNLALDPNSGQPIVISERTGVLLSGPVTNSDGILIGMSRGISEFSLDGVLGLISGPSPHMRLVLGLQEVRALSEQPPIDTNVAAVTTDLVTNGSDDEKTKKPKKKSLQHNLYLYTEADLELTPDDFGRKGRRLGRIELDPDGDALQQDFDLTEIVLDGNLGSLGIRIQSAMDHAQPGNEDEDQDSVEAESETAESRAAAPRATAFMLTLEVVAD